MYADYEFYTNTYYGAQLNESEFARVATRASSFIDYYTRGKAASYSGGDEVKMCCCALAEQYQIIEKATAQGISGGELQSQTVGAWSKTYRSGAETADAARQNLAKLAAQYLAGTGLLYRGGGCCVPPCCNNN